MAALFGTIFLGLGLSAVIIATYSAVGLKTVDFSLSTPDSNYRFQTELTLEGGRSFAMVMPLLVTKFYIPRPRAEFVPRPQLIESLQQGIVRPLTLVTAPAGFGKSSLVASWALQANRAVAWLALEEADNDTDRFWYYLVAALQAHLPTQGAAIFNALQAPQPPAQAVLLTLLVNELANLAQPLVMVLDDYHLITEMTIHQGMIFLLDHLPPTFHLMVLSRTDPPWPLARLRARGQLNELREAKLRFTVAEATTFLNDVMGLGLSREQVMALEDRTEGWIAGLQLAATAMQGGTNRAAFVAGFSGSHRYILDYLMDEVIRQQAPATLQFLLATSILDRFCAGLCAAVTGLPDCQQHLRHLEAANLFLVALDEQRTWYRYHHLFASLLQFRLRQEQADRLPTLHQCASQWLAGAGLLHEAIDHALAAADLTAAADLMAQLVASGAGIRQINALLTWLKVLPTPILQQRPQLILYGAWALFVTGQLQAAALLLALTAPQHEQPDFALYGEFAALRANLARSLGQLAAAKSLTTQALATLSAASPWHSFALLNQGIIAHAQDEFTLAQHAYRQLAQVDPATDHFQLAYIGYAFTAAVQLLEGKLRQADQIYAQALAVATKRQQRQLATVGYLEVGLAWLAYERNHLTEARHHALTAQQLCSNDNLIDVTLQSYFVLALLSQAAGDRDGVESELGNMKALVQNADAEHVNLLLDAYCATLYLLLGEDAPARAWCAAHPTLGARRTLFPAFTRFAFTLRPRTYLFQKEFDAAQQSIDELKRLPIPMLQLEAELLQALLYHAAGKRNQAESLLVSLLVRTELEGYVRLFVDYGKPFAELLAGLKAPAGVTAPYLTHLRRACQSEQTPPPPISSAPLIEPLNEREVEVLQLVAQGLSNREIADRLFLALSTIKWYTNIIYDKLNVSTRTQAIRKAQELDLIH